MRKLKGFTLIELLIVVAIIAILAAIAIPNFLDAQIRSKVSRAKTDMRTISIALESYMVDVNMYPGSGEHLAGGPWTVNGGFPAGSTAQTRITFTTYAPVNAWGYANSCTTPIGHITTLPSDPFANKRGSVFGYWNAVNAGWLLWSYGPDTDEKTRGQIETYLRTPQAYIFVGAGANTVYNPYLSNPTMSLLIAGYTYDGTNGTVSAGDVWRVKQ